MKLDMMALYDAKVEAFMTPFFAQSVGAAVRSLTDLVNGGGEEAPAKHPEDFSLFRFGTWTDDGRLELERAPVQVVLCVNLKPQER